MKLTFDTETTGVDTSTARIVEPCFKLEDIIFTTRINPGVPIPQESTDVHGIQDSDVAHLPKFSDVGHGIYVQLQEVTVIVGYNVQFDIDILCAEFDRMGIHWDLSKVTIVDPFKLWKVMEVRTLSQAHKRFVGRPLEDAHTAEADVFGAEAVLSGMLKAFDLEGETMQELATLCDPDRATWVGSTNHFVWKDGVPVFNFGKHKGVPMDEEKGYLTWMQRESFSRGVLKTIQDFFDGKLVVKS